MPTENFSLNKIKHSFPNNFLWGVATAPAHVEDELSDSWINWADSGHVVAYKNQIQPEKRLLFWSEPEIEIGYASQLGINIYRLGLDWGRFFENQLTSDNDPNWLEKNPDFVKFKKIIKLLKDQNIKIMLTLYHHSHPMTHLRTGGWTHNSSVKLFSEWAQNVIDLLVNDVDYWITFNEPNIYNLLTYASGIWPHGGFHDGILSFLKFGPFKGNFIKSQHNMVKAHKIIYANSKLKFPKIQIGIAQHMAYFLNTKGQKNFLSQLLDKFFNYSFLNEIQDSMDFVGINYYGAEYIKGTKAQILNNREYSEAGRAIYPNGFYQTIKTVYEKYKKPIFITENGIADSTDLIRAPYIYEHLTALCKAAKENIPIYGYMMWTLSDNWEWADGYAPKFGLMNVDRSDLRKRTPRPSYELYKNIIAENGFLESTREFHWNEYLKMKNNPRPFCRANDGIHGLDSPVDRPYIGNDWRFNL